MTEKLKVTKALKSAVNAYLMARANAEVHRERVSIISRKILQRALYYTDTNKFPRLVKERITDPELTYLLSDEQASEFLITVKTALLDAGYDIKPIKGEPQHMYTCPALVAEHLQHMTERVLIETAAEILGEDKEFISGLDLDHYHKLIDLVVGLVVNLPGYKSPILPKKETKDED